MLDVYHGKHGEMFIDIWNCRASIAYEVWENGVGHNVYCTNSDELQEDLLEEILRQGGAINLSGRMYCPPELAKKAHFEDTV